MGKAIKNLEEYVEIDNRFVDKTDNSDFSKFCLAHVEDITNVVECIKEIKHLIEDLDSDDFDKIEDYKLVNAYYQKVYEIIKNVID